MPLVSPSWGITERPCALDFMAVAKEVGLDPAGGCEAALAGPGGIGMGYQVGHLL